MKKMVKFGSRKRFNGEEGSEVSAPTARGGVPVLGSDEEQREFMEGMDRRSRLLTETKRSEDDPLEQVARMTQKKPTSFRDAFAQARREGKDKFTFNGKSYTTELASSKPKSSPSAKSAEPSVGGRETAEENLTKRRPTDLASSKARHEGMKTAGERSQRESDAEKARESRLGSSILARDRLGSEPDAYIVNRRRRAAMEEAKESIPPSRTFGAGAMSAKGLGSMSGFSKGGKVGSASKRADGIAQRGKTRGKMY